MVSRAPAARQADLAAALASSSPRGPQTAPGASAAVPAALANMSANNWVDPSTATGSNQVSSADSPGSADKVSPVKSQVPVQPSGFVRALVTGQAIPLSTQQRFFRKITFFGVKQWANGVPTVANGQNVYAGFESAYMPWQIFPYAGVPWELQAPLGHLYDASNIFITGQTGDNLFYFIE